jgi:hypothetical protein
MADGEKRTSESKFTMPPTHVSLLLFHLLSGKPYQRARCPLFLPTYHKGSTTVWRTKIATAEAYSEPKVKGDSLVFMSFVVADCPKCMEVPTDVCLLCAFGGMETRSNVAHEYHFRLDV